MLPEAFAQNGQAGQAGEFLRYGVGVRASTLGRAYTGLAQGASAIYWNPAGLAVGIERLSGITLMSSLTNLYNYSNYNYIALGVPLIEFTGLESNDFLKRELGKWSFGIAYLSFTMGKFEERDRDNIKIGNGFSDSQKAIIVSLARQIEIFKQKIDFGANYKFISHHLFYENKNAQSFDFGLRLQPSYKWIVMGIKVQDINQPDFGFAKEFIEKIPLSSRAGLAIFPSIVYPKLKGLSIAMDYDLISPQKRKKNWYLGIEYNLMSVLPKVPIVARLGTNSSDEKISLGLGINFNQNSVTPSQVTQFMPSIDLGYIASSNKALSANIREYGLRFSYTHYTSKNFYDIALRLLKSNYGKKDVSISF